MIYGALAYGGSGNDQIEVSLQGSYQQLVADAGSGNNHIRIYGYNGTGTAQVTAVMGMTSCSSRIIFRVGTLAGMSRRIWARNGTVSGELNLMLGGGAAGIGWRDLRREAVIFNNMV